MTPPAGCTVTEAGGDVGSAAALVGVLDAGETVGGIGLAAGGVVGVVVVVGADVVVVETGSAVDPVG